MKLARFSVLMVDLLIMGKTFFRKRLVGRVLQLFKTTIMNRMSFVILNYQVRPRVIDRFCHLKSFLLVLNLVWDHVAIESIVEVEPQGQL